MRLINYNYSPLSVSNRLNRLLGTRTSAIERFGELFDGFWDTETVSNQPAVDFYEDDKNFFVRLELPGVKKDAISLEFENAVLTLSSDHSETKKSEQTSYSFKRSIALPEGAAPDKVTANLKDGILTVTIPKREVAEKRLIKVN